MIAPADYEHPIATWRGQCVPERHDSSESWEIEARTEVEAAIKLRAQLRTEDRLMPADLEWSMV